MERARGLRGYTRKKNKRTKSIFPKTLNNYRRDDTTSFYGYTNDVTGEKPHKYGTTIGVEVGFGNDYSHDDGCFPTIA